MACVERLLKGACLLVCFASLPLGDLWAESVAETANFVVLGDIPYNDWNDGRTAVVGDEQERILNDRIAPAIKEAAPPFVIHYGDIKGGGAPCSDELIAERVDRIGNLLPGRVVYTPGDNDWTDCDRPGTGYPESELERLGFLRRIAFVEREMASALSVERQPLFPENARWRHSDILLVTVHEVGTNNGREQILEDDPEMALAQVDARDAAGKAWLDRAFDIAARKSASAVVVVFQADIFKRRGRDCSRLSRRTCDGHRWLRDVLERKARWFGGPVLVVHGDTSPFCLDRPIGGLGNLWRLNGPGDYLTLDAAMVTVDPSASNRPFTARGLITGKEPASICL